MAPPTEEELEEFRRQAMANPSYMASLPTWDSSYQADAKEYAPMSVDPSVYSMLSSSPSASSSTNLLSSDLENQISGLKRQYEANVFEANKEPELSGTQVGVSAAVKLLPLLLGMAIAKRKSLGAALGAQAGLGASGAYEKNALATQENKAKRAGLLATQNLKDLSTAQGQRFQVEKQEDSQKAQSERDKAIQDRIDARFEKGQSRADERAKNKTPGMEKYLETRQATSEAARKKLESVSQKTQDRHIGAISSLRTYSDLAKSREAADPKQIELLSQSFKEAISNADAGASFSPERIFSDVMARNKLDPNSPSGQFFKKILIVGRSNAIAQSGVATNQDVAQEVANLMPSYLENNQTYLKRLGWLAERTKQNASTALDTEVKQGRMGGKSLMEELDKVYGELGFGEQKVLSEDEFIKKYLAEKEAMKGAR